MCLHREVVSGYDGDGADDNDDDGDDDCDGRCGDDGDGCVSDDCVSMVVLLLMLNAIECM